MHADHLIVDLTIPGQDCPIVCIPHGAGGLHRRDDFARFAARIEHASNPGRAVGSSYRGTDDATIYLAYHAHGCIAARISLRGCKAEPALAIQREAFRVRSQLHAQTSDRERGAYEGGGLLSLEEAVALVVRLPKMVTEACSPVGPGRGSLADVRGALALILGEEGWTGETRWRTVWELGANPNLRVGIMSATTGLPEKMLAGIKSDIEHNPWVRAVFPNLRPGTKRGQNKWSELSIHVERDDDLTDPSLQIYGLSSKILGSRLDLIIIDDLLNMENTTTPYINAGLLDNGGPVVASLPPDPDPDPCPACGSNMLEDGYCRTCEDSDRGM